MFWKSKPKETVIQEVPFRVVLPGEWVKVEDPECDVDRFGYRNTNDREYLVVSIYYYPEVPSEEDRTQTFNRLMDISRVAETAESSPVEMTEIFIGKHNGSHAARYMGIEPASQRCFERMHVSKPMAIATFYYESIGLTRSQSHKRTEVIMATFALSVALSPN
jgi:hypothetical protein